MTTVLYNEEELSIEFNGHANAGEQGKDTVCAGLSTLIGALRAMCEAHEEYMTADMTFGDGHARFVLKPQSSFTWNAITLLRTIFIGCAVLAENYPENVRATEERSEQDAC